MEVLGVLSGIGHLPVEVARSAKSLGYEVIAVGVVPDIDPELAESVDKYYDINIGKIGKIISTLKKHKVTKVTMIGKVTKEVLYKAGAIVPDLRAIKLLASIPDRKDDTIMNAIVKEIESECAILYARKNLANSNFSKSNNGVMTAGLIDNAEKDGFVSTKYGYIPVRR